MRKTFAGSLSLFALSAALVPSVAYAQQADPRVRAAG